VKRTISILALAVALLCGPVARPQAQTPCRTVSFVLRDAGGVNQIHAMCLDGSNVRQLTSGKYPANYPVGRRTARS